VTSVPTESTFFEIFRDEPTNLYKILYLHWSSGSALDLLRQLALEPSVQPAHYRGDLVRQIAAHHRAGIGGGQPGTENRQAALPGGATVDEQNWEEERPGKPWSPA
jgi:hypothetical protein